MGKTLPPRVKSGKSKLVPAQPNTEDVQALKEEIARLRELVIELSELAIKNVIDNIGGGG